MGGVGHGRLDGSGRARCASDGGRRGRWIGLRDSRRGRAQYGLGHVSRCGLPVVMLPVLRLVDRLLQLYERGGIFSARNARIIYHSGERRVPWPSSTPWRLPYASSSRRHLEWGVDDVELALFFVGVTIIIVGHVMRLGQK